MERTKLSELLRIISSEHTRGPGQSNLDSRFYTPWDFRKNSLRIEKNRVRQEDYRSRHYVRNKNLNKMGYK